MFNWNRIRMAGSRGRMGVAAVTMLAVAGCGHVNREDLATELDVIRAEMRQGDEAVETRLTAEIESVESQMQARLAALEGDLNTLAGEFDVAMERFDSAIRFSAPVHFAFDDATVRPADYPVLDRFANVVREYYGDATITVEGFTDPAGSVQYNQSLGQRRADAVRVYLESAGIPADRMRAVSYGEDSSRLIMPNAQGPMEAGWQNRRVAMVIDFGPSGSQPAVAQAPGSAEDL